MILPTDDGDVTPYVRTPGRDATAPRIYFVNGMRVLPAEHAESALSLSALTEHTVFGVYNKTAGQKLGSVLDFLQCVGDSGQSVLQKLGQYAVNGFDRALDTLLSPIKRGLQRFGLPRRDPVHTAEHIRRVMPEWARLRLMRDFMDRNPATVALFDQLIAHRTREQYIVAHSQGNLITANALWGVAIVYGDGALHRMRVYSLASPTPAWPMGIRGRRKVYGFENDLVTLTDPHNLISRLRLDRLPVVGERVAPFTRTPGDWRTHGDGGIGLGGHAIELNMALNFARRIRSDLGLLPLETQGR